MLDQQALIGATKELEPLPPTVHQLAAIASRRDWSAMEAEEVISMDPALAGKLLGLANSVASASRVEIVSIRDAVVRMGIGAALAMVTATAVSARTRLALPQYRLAEGELWRHSVSTSIAAQALPSFCSVPIPPESFTAALMHDLGKLVISRFVGGSLLKRLDRVRDDGAHTPIEAELEVLGVHHAELGGLIAEGWRLPAGIVKGIMYHHTPDEGGALVCDAVHVANVIAKQVGRDQTREDADHADGDIGPDEADGELELELCPGSLERLGMTSHTLERCSHTVADRLEQVLSAYN
jgi:HD-like signal output (HDOD) protein|tara:strand:+ start:2310 stop:3197 length:888 start_codon:yes stop_codon:yes gene_type:complete